MLQGHRIFIAEDEAIVAWDLADSIREAEGEVVGPVATVKEGLTLLAKESFHAAILDVQLADRDVTPLAMILIERGIVVVFHTGTGVPEAISTRYGDQPICRKPIASRHVIRRLAELMRLSP
ncbi:MAG: response regulator [Gammaproteobacteria bacterium]